MPSGVITPSPADLEAGTALLKLVSDWDAWTLRRVDSFRFSGDDERVLERRQSMDFMAPPEVGELSNAVTDKLGGWPIPITFVNKWRLQQFSLRDEANRALPLLPRAQSTPIAVGMLIALGNSLVTGKPVGQAEDHMPAEMRTALTAIAASDPSESLQACAALGDASDPKNEWGMLASNDAFMGLVYELARGFPLTAVYPECPRGQRVLKFAYSSYVVPGTTRERRVVRIVHGVRSFVSWSRDRMDSGFWYTRQDPKTAPRSSVVLSTICDVGREGLREGGPSVACVHARLIGPDGRRRTVRLRPNDAVAIEGLPPGPYQVDLWGRSGFVVDSDSRPDFGVADGETARVEVRARRTDVSRRDVWAPPLPARPASHLRVISRGLTWHSKPLVLRVRLGDGGSYHCEFEAPPGMHATRGRLISDANVDDDRRRRLDVVLASTQFAHLYAPANKAKPSAGYAFFNLRPRSETIARPALATAIVALLVLGFIAWEWLPEQSFKHGPRDSSGLLVLLLGGPTALAAYFAQALPSRVTNSILYGLRFAALLPAAATLAVGIVILLGRRSGWAEPCLVALIGVTAITIGILFFAHRFAEHPPEQRRIDKRQGPGFEEDFSVDAAPEGVPSVSKNTPGCDGCAGGGETDPVRVRDKMLQRAGGLSTGTVRALLGQPALRDRWESRIPPALYFDSAETVPTFLGLADHEDWTGGIGSAVSG